MIISETLFSRLVSIASLMQAFWQIYNFYIPLIFTSIVKLWKEMLRGAIPYNSISFLSLSFFLPTMLRESISYHHIPFYPIAWFLGSYLSYLLETSNA